MARTYVRKRTEAQVRARKAAAVLTRGAPLLSDNTLGSCAAIEDREEGRINKTYQRRVGRYDRKAACYYPATRKDI